MKYIIYFLLVFVFVCCDNKKAKLDDLYAEQSQIKKQIDSVAHLQIVFGEKTDELKMDSTQMNQEIEYAIQRDVLALKLKKINFSIDSLSKY